VRAWEEKQRKTDADKSAGAESTDGKLDATVGTRASTAADAIKDTLAPLSKILEREKVVWQWLHREGFRDYSQAVSLRIEEAYQRGDSVVRLKTGKGGSVPMEVFFHEMLQYDPTSGNTRKVQRNGKNGRLQKLRRKVAEIKRRVELGRPLRRFNDPKEQAESQGPVGRLDKSASMREKYHETGICQEIANSMLFFLISMIVITVNVLWIGIDAEYNDAPTIVTAPWGFQVMENIFACYFTFELAVRFGAFKRKRDTMKDMWFVFDFFLLVLIILETWAVRLLVVVEDDTGSATGGRQLGVLRVARLLRLARLSQLLKICPELMTLIRGIVVAMRGVFFTMALLLLLLYMFGIMFKTFAEKADDQTVKDTFRTVPKSMLNLLLTGTLMDGPTVTYAILDDGQMPHLCFLFLLFVFLSSFTVLNMLIGILCEVISRVDSEAKEGEAVDFLKNHLLEFLECYDKDGNGHINAKEFGYMTTNADFTDVLERFGVDCQDLISMKDILYEDKDISATEKDEDKELRIGLSYDDFLEVVMRLRGGNSSTVSDIVELREYMQRCFERMFRRLENGSSMSRPCSPDTGQSPKPKAEVSPWPNVSQEANDLMKSVLAHDLRAAATAQSNEDQGPSHFEATVLAELAKLHASQDEIRAEVAASREEAQDIRAQLQEVKSHLTEQPPQTAQ